MITTLDKITEFNSKEKVFIFCGQKFTYQELLNLVVLHQNISGIKMHMEEMGIDSKLRISLLAQKLNVHGYNEINTYQLDQLERLVTSQKFQLFVIQHFS